MKCMRYSMVVMTPMTPMGHRNLTVARLLICRCRYGTFAEEEVADADRELG